MMKRLFFLPIIIAAVLAASAHTPAGCKQGDPTGYFEGTESSNQNDKLDISLNLACADGHFTGELATASGTFLIKGGYFEAGRLHLQFDAGNHVGTIEARLDDGVLGGTFYLPGDSSPFQVRRVIRAKGSNSEFALNLTPGSWRTHL